MQFSKASYLPLDLTEIPQTNSLRWQVLYKRDDNSFEDQTGVFKCKDYFNDIVAYYQGIKFCKYGFDTDRMKFNEEGIYVVLSQLTHVDNLIHNVTMLAEKAASQGFPGLTIEKLDETRAFMFIPRVFFSSTYTISFTTYLIRVSHCTDVFDNYETFMEKHPTRSIDCPFKHYYQQAVEHGFANPTPGWVYSGKSNPEYFKRYPSEAHHAGVNAILNYVAMETDDEDEEETEGEF